MLPNLICPILNSAPTYRKDMAALAHVRIFFGVSLAQWLHTNVLNWYGHHTLKRYAKCSSHKWARLIGAIVVHLECMISTAVTYWCTQFKRLSYIGGVSLIEPYITTCGLHRHTYRVYRCNIIHICNIDSDEMRCGNCGSDGMRCGSCEAVYHGWGQIWSMLV